LIENGGCLPPLLSSVSLPAGEESNKEAARFPIMETARRCFPAGCLPNIYALRIIKRISQLQILTVNKFYTKYAHGFFFLDVVFPSPLIDKHFRVVVKPFHNGHIFFFVHPFENLIGRYFPQFSPVTCGNAVLIHDMMSPTAGTVSVSNVVSIYHEIPFISNSIFTMSFYC